MTVEKRLELFSRNTDKMLLTKNFIRIRAFLSTQRAIPIQGFSNFKLFFVFLKVLKNFFDIIVVYVTILVKTASCSSSTYYPLSL